MNRTEALAALKTINNARTSVNADFTGTGFFFADAVAALGDFERASRHLASLIKVGAVRCTTVRLGFTSHDFYTVA
jgi:hypothetical protein